MWIPISRVYACSKFPIRFQSQPARARNWEHHSHRGQSAWLLRESSLWIYHFPAAAPWGGFWGGAEYTLHVKR